VYVRVCLCLCAHTREYMCIMFVFHVALICGFLKHKSCVWMPDQVHACIYVFIFACMCHMADALLGNVYAYVCVSVHECVVYVYICYIWYPTEARICTLHTCRQADEQIQYTHIPYIHTQGGTDTCLMACCLPCVQYAINVDQLKDKDVSSLYESLYVYMYVHVHLHAHMLKNVEYARDDDRVNNTMDVSMHVLVPVYVYRYVNTCICRWV
jgi:hypothetical protein